MAIGRLCALAPFRSAGLASVLLMEAERRMTSLGCAKINLLVEPQNAYAVGFYANRGYVVDDLVFMEKWLGERERPARGLPSGPTIDESP